ncbi:hypothetical protein ACPV50_09560 [Vibrio astriarenae]
MKKTILPTIAASVLLAACGGSSSGGGSTGPSELITGRAIDGYIVGATVHYDFNLNGIADSDEPSAITQEGGVFTLNGELSEEQLSCLDYVPLIVDVPVGAIDEDLGEITEAYTLSFPPAFTLSTSVASNDAYVTPLTTMLWESAQRAVLEQEGEPYSCALARDNEGIRNAINDTMRNVAGDLVWHFNMSEEELWEDYIATGNTKVYDAAQQLMVAIQKAFDETYNLSQQNPGAHVNVAYYLNDSTDWARPENAQLWYRSVAIRKDNFWSERVEAVDDEWNTARLIRLYEEDAMSLETNSVGYVNEYRNMSDDLNWPQYICSKAETLAVTVAAKDDEFGMENKSSFYDKSEAECDALSFSDPANSQNMLLSTMRVSAPYDQEGSRYKWDSIPSRYAHWLGFSDDLDNIDIATFIADLSELPRSYGGQSNVGSDWWSHLVRFVENGNNTSEHRSSEPAEMPNGDMSSHYRFISFSNGTFKYECTNGNGGWYDCTN